MLGLLPGNITRELEGLDFQVPLVGAAPDIARLLNSTVVQGGKRIRPALTLLMGAILGVPSDRLAPYARAAELTHSASLAHDDVIDVAKTRRGSDSINVVASNRRAVLAGDLLLSQVMVEISRLGEIEAMRELSLAVSDLVRGEWLQLEARGVVRVRRSAVDEVARLKTASLIAWCCWVPALLASLDSDLQQKCREFGSAVGLSFQWIDDVVDFEPAGPKGFAQDLHSGLVNAVGVECLDADPESVPRVQAWFVRSGEPAVEFPWSFAQVEAAQARVRDRARTKMAEALTLLKVIVERTAGTQGRDVSEHVQCFVEVFEALSDRTS